MFNLNSKDAMALDEMNDGLSPPFSSTQSTAQHSPASGRARSPLISFRATPEPGRVSTATGAPIWRRDCVKRTSIVAKIVVLVEADKSVLGPRRLALHRFQDTFRYRARTDGGLWSSGAACDTSSRSKRQSRGDPDFIGTVCPPGAQSHAWPDEANRSGTQILAQPGGTDRRTSRPESRVEASVRVCQDQTRGPPDPEGI